jgi:hypothetical protein
MWNTLFALFVILHGLVHIWFFVLSRDLVKFEAEMGWTGESWLFTRLIGPGATRSLAGLGYLAAAALLVVGGVAFLGKAQWAGTFLVIASVVSALVIVFFWDGSGQRLVEKGLLGFLIDLAIILLVLVVRWPAFWP